MRTALLAGERAPLGGPFSLEASLEARLERQSGSRDGMNVNECVNMWCVNGIHFALAATQHEGRTIVRVHSQ